MKKKSLKKKIVLALAGIILAGSVGWNQIPVQAAVNGEPVCTHDNTEIHKGGLEYIPYGLGGHMERRLVEVACIECMRVIYVEYEYGPLESHDYDSGFMEDLHNGLYMHWIRCRVCGYYDEVLSDRPDDPRV